MPTNAPLTKPHTPPVPLVQTWCLLLRDDEKEVREHANKMLINAFGNMRAVVEFVKANKIKV